MADKKDDSDAIKIILLGATGVGKTNLINAFLGRKFEDYSETNNASSFEDEITYKNKQYIYYIWDTAGQEKFRSVNKIFIRNSKIILFVYSIDNRNSFNEIDFWMNQVKEILGNDKHIIMALIANKSDLYETQIVMDDEGENAAKEYGIQFLTTSALTSADSFILFVKKLIIDYIEMTERNTKESNKDKGVKINKKNKQKKKKCC